MSWTLENLRRRELTNYHPLCRTSITIPSQIMDTMDINLIITTHITTVTTTTITVTATTILAGRTGITTTIITMGHHLITTRRHSHGTLRGHETIITHLGARLQLPQDPIRLTFLIGQCPQPTYRPSQTSPRYLGATTTTTTIIVLAITILETMVMPAMTIIDRPYLHTERSQHRLRA